MVTQTAQSATVRCGDCVHGDPQRWGHYQSHQCVAVNQRNLGSRIPDTMHLVRKIRVMRAYSKLRGV